MIFISSDEKKIWIQEIFLVYNRLHRDVASCLFFVLKRYPKVRGRLSRIFTFWPKSSTSFKKNFVLIAEKRLRYFGANYSEGGKRNFWSKNKFDTKSGLFFQHFSLNSRRNILKVFVKLKDFLLNSSIFLPKLKFLANLRYKFLVNCFKYRNAVFIQWDKI